MCWLIARESNVWRSWNSKRKVVVILCNKFYLKKKIYGAKSTHNVQMKEFRLRKIQTKFWRNISIQE